MSKVWYNLDDEERIQCRRCDQILGKDDRVQMEYNYNQISIPTILNVLCEECINAPKRKSSHAKTT